MGLDLVRCQEPERWDSFTAGSPQGSIFCQTPFLRALGTDFDLWLLTDNGRTEAGAVVLLKDGRPLPAPHEFTQYQGLLLAGQGCDQPVHRRTSWTLKVVGELLEGLSGRYPRLSFCLHHSFEDLRAIQWFNYHRPERGRFSLELCYSGLIDLKAFPAFEDLVRSFRLNRRRNYNQALDKGLKAGVSQDWELLDRLHGLTFARQGIQRSGQERSLVRGLTRAALEEGFGELLVCRDKDGEPVSANLFIRDQRCGYYLFGGTDPAKRSLNGGTLLFVEAIRRCFQEGLDWVDVVGINSPHRGDFKTSFNARPAPYFVVDWERP